jgi:hypothetical protein
MYFHTFVLWASDWGWIEQTLHSRRSPPEISLSLSPLSIVFVLECGSEHLIKLENSIQSLYHKMSLYMVCYLILALTTYQSHIGVR